MVQVPARRRTSTLLNLPVLPKQPLSLQRRKGQRDSARYSSVELSAVHTTLTFRFCGARRLGWGGAR